MISVLWNSEEIIFYNINELIRNNEKEKYFFLYMKCQYVGNTITHTYIL